MPDLKPENQILETAETIAAFTGNQLLTRLRAEDLTQEELEARLDKELDDGLLADTAESIAWSYGRVVACLILLVPFWGLTLADIPKLLHGPGVQTLTERRN